MKSKKTCIFLVIVMISTVFTVAVPVSVSPVEGNGINTWGTIVIQPGPEEGKDAYYERGLPTSAFPGDEYWMTVGMYTYARYEYWQPPPFYEWTWDWVLSEPKYEYKLFIQFPLTSIPIGATIDSATLYLYCYQRPVCASGLDLLDNRYPHFPGQNLTLLQVSAPWEEGEVYKNPPSCLTDEYTTTFISKNGPDQLIAWDATDHVQEWWTGETPNYGFMINVSYDKHLGYACFYSSDFSYNHAWRPKLMVSCTLPDLICEDIYTVPEKPVAGESCTVHYSIRNIGDCNAISRQNEYIRTNFFLDDNYIGSDTIYQLNIDQTHTGDLQIESWPSDGEVHNLNAIVDTENIFSELNEENNEKSVSITGACSDLIIQDIRIEPYIFDQGQNINIYTRIKNDGTADASDFELWLFFDGNPIKVYEIPLLTKGTPLTKYLSYSWPFDYNYHEIKVSVDKWDDVIEENEANNEKSKLFKAINPTSADLSYSLSSYDFGDKYVGISDSTTFEIWNSGIGTLSYTLTEDYDWITINPTSGDSTGEHDIITVSIDTTGLELGSYTCDILIDSNGNNEVFSVSVNVILEPPHIVWVDDDYHIGGNNDGHIWGFNAFDKIQDGINAVAENGKVIVFRGTYFEEIMIDKSIKLIGSTMHMVGSSYPVAIIQPSVSGSGTGIYLNSYSSATIKYFTLKGFHYGIYLASSSNNEIIINNMENNDYGIYFDNSYDNTIRGNTISNSYFGIYMVSSGGNTLFYNKINDNINQLQSINSLNTWHNEYFRGNHWSDYYGIDDGSGERYPGDGIGDTLIPHRSVDNYPIVQMWGNVYNKAKDECYYEIQESINLAYIGDIIEVSNGVYYENLAIDKELKLYGESKEQTFIQGDGDGTGIIINGQTGVSVERFTISNYKYGIQLHNSNINTIIENKITDISSSGMFMVNSDGNTIDDNSISFCNFGIYMQYSDGNTIVRNTITDNSRHGIHLNPESNYNTIFDNDIINNTERGICTASNSINNDVSLNRISGSEFGIYLGSSNNSVSLNTVSNNEKYGIYLINAESSNIYGNILSDNNNSMFISHSIDCTISGNTVSNSTRYGIFLSYSNNSTVTGNTLLNNNNTGITLYHNSENIIVSDNTLSNNSFAGIYLINGLNNILTDNNISDTNGDGIIIGNVGTVIASNNEISDNTISNSSNNGIFVICSGSCNSFVDNYISNNNENGIYLSNTASNTLNDNTILENDYGIRLIMTNNNTIFHNNIIGNTHQLLNYLSTNTWHNDVNEGNYWSDYTGIDNDGDGIGDTDIPHQEVDDSPLVFPIELVHNTDKDTYYTNIQDALDDANPGDTIMVGSGTYYENIVIDESVNLFGDTREIPTIQGDGTGIGIFMDTISNTTIDNFNLNNFENGVYLKSSSSNEITNNTITDTSYGIYIDPSYDNIIDGNSILNNGYGIYLEDSGGNIVSNNIISENQNGLYLDKKSNNNEIYHNNFIENDVQAEDVGTTPGTTAMKQATSGATTMAKTQMVMEWEKTHTGTWISSRLWSPQQMYLLSQMQMARTLGSQDG